MSLPLSNSGSDLESWAALALVKKLFSRAGATTANTDPNKFIASADQGQQHSRVETFIIEIYTLCRGGVLIVACFPSM